MAFWPRRRSATPDSPALLPHTRSYYLVESYHEDQGKTQRRTLCYLGREQDGTDTLMKSLAHWEKVELHARKELRNARGEPCKVMRRRMGATETRIGIIKKYIELMAQSEAERR